MKWPWTKRIAHAETHREHKNEGAEARRAAEEHLEEARAQWPEVNRVAASLRDLRRRNGFSEQLIYILRNDDGKGER